MNYFNKEEGLQCLRAEQSRAEQSRRIPAFDFIRAVCALGIVFYHFICHGSCKTLYPILKTFPNGSGDVGYEIVTVFFLISGALLYHNHPIISSKKIFYKKRWLSLFPAFYIAYASIFLIRELTGKSPMRGKELGLFPLTLVGFDGYFAAYTSFKDWYILGEWFLGAIILCYLLYPLFIMSINSHEVEFYIAISSLYFIFIDAEFLRQDAFRNVFSCIFSFAVGMAIDKHKLYDVGVKRPPTNLLLN